ncbi:MAG: nickel pincer cofactor biosynthesis protein LarB [Oscillospiraceae bacterium]|jgi:NCAIR mutase (PurE)-related protein|nr:nickel pincer cofactor biosynthesis protein LarB [Oscillospiraceae bacterium]
MDVTVLLEQVKSGKIAPEAAAEKLRLLSGEDLGYALLDHQRQLRTGAGEVVYCAGKSPEQAAEIFEKLAAAGGNVLGTRAPPEHFEKISVKTPGAVFHKQAGLVSLIQNPPKPLARPVAVCSGGTADLPVAEEAALTAEFYGARVLRLYDAGIAGLHRLVGRLPELREAGAVIAVAGMEGALPSVLAGLVEAPVIALPTSVGYGTGLGGYAALLTMLNSCAPGIAAVNIDNGFGAGFLAARILTI